MAKGIINYVGYLGHHNLGDEAIYSTIHSFFNQYRFVHYAGTAFSQITLFGGGTLLPYWCSLVKPIMRPTKFNYVFGSGTHDPVFHGQYDPVIVERLRSFDFRLIGVRDEFSRNMLNEWGVKAEVIGDPCLSSKPHSNVKRKDKRIAVNIGSDGLVWGRDETRLIRELAKVCKILKAHGYQVVVIPCNKNDVCRIKEFAFQNNLEIFSNWFNIASVLDFIASCRVLIGQRLHSIVLSASTYTPFISIEYRPKCFHFAESVGFEKYTIRTDEITSEEIMAMFFDLIDNWSAKHDLLKRAVNSYRKKQIDFAARLAADIESIDSDKWVPPNPLTLMQKMFWNVDSILNAANANIWSIWNKYFFLRMLPYLK